MVQNISNQDMNTWPKTLNAQDADIYLEQLRSKSIDEFKPYNLDGQILIAKILKIHDTDTFTIGWNDNGTFVKTNIRLSDIDAPELHSRANGGDEARLCRMGRNWLISKYLNAIVNVQCSKNDKYGRLLASVIPFDSDISINKMLIDNKFVRFYGGTLTKLPWTQDELSNGITIATKLNVSDD